MKTRHVVFALMAMLAFGLGSPVTTPAENEAIESNAPFGRTVYLAAEGSLWTKWRLLQSEISTQKDIIRACRIKPDECPVAMKRFLTIIDHASLKQGKAKLEVVNREVNMAIRWVADIEYYGVPEIWTSPLVTFQNLHGDCTDFAIAKYVALIQAGFASSDLQIIIVQNGSTGEYHTVLAARDGDRWLVLDNLRVILLEDTALPNYRPMFSINESGVRQYGTPSPAGGFIISDWLLTHPM